MTDSASRLSAGKALGALIAVAVFFALLTLGPSVWARGQVNLFIRDLTRVWTSDTLIPAPDACPPADPALTQPMAARLARAQNDDPNLLLHQGELACVQGDRARARRAWAAEAGRIPSPQVASLFAAIAAFSDHAIIDTSYQKEIGNYGSKRGAELEKQGNLLDAVHWYELSLAYAPSEKTAGKLAALYRKLGKDASVEDVWRRLQSAFSSDAPDYWWAVGQAAEQRKDWEAAAQAYEKGAALASDADAYRYLLRGGLMWLRAHEFEKSEAAYKKAIALEPKKVDGYLGVGHVYRYQKQYDQAAPWYEKAIQVAPNRFAAYYYLGTMAREQGDYQDALNWFSRSLARNPSHSPTYYQKALTLDAMGDRRGAIAALEEAVDRSKSPPSSWRELLESWRRYPDIDTDPRKFARLGREAEQKQAWEQALTLYEKAASLAQGADAYPYLLRIGSLRIRQRDYEGAEKAYRQALALNDQAIAPYIGIGESYRYRGDAQQAESWYRKALVLAPEDWRPLYFLGLATYKQGRYEEALAFLNKSLRKHPENAWGEYFRALSLKQLGREEAAIASLKKAIELHANPPESWRKLLEQWQRAAQ